MPPLGFEHATRLGRKAGVQKNNRTQEPDSPSLSWQIRRDDGILAAKQLMSCFKNGSVFKNR
jgi:hypothetical protein